MVVVDELDDNVVPVACDRDEVDGGKVLYEFTKTHIAGMGTYRDATSGSHKQHNDNLVDSVKATSVDLAEVQSLSLEHLLKNHSILCVFTRSNPNRSNTTG